MSDVTITTQQMYDLLLKIDRTVTQLASTVGTQTNTIKDHEDRLRAIESAADNGSRITAMEEDVKAIRSDLEGMKRIVYAFPSLATFIAAVALILTLVRT